VPTCSSSPIPAAAQRLAAPAALAPDQYRSLLDDLAHIADPRHLRGRRHTLGTVLAVAVAAVLAGAKSLAAIGEWAADAPGPVLAALGARRDPLRRVYRPPAEALAGRSGGGCGQLVRPNHMLRGTRVCTTENSGRDSTSSIQEASGTPSPANHQEA
jgi:DDE_Tnp_1-associated